MRQTHELAGKVVSLRGTSWLKGAKFVVEDWWENIDGRSWMDSVNNPAALQYAMRSAAQGLPLDNEVVYGKVGLFGYLVHVSELMVEEQEEAA